MEAFDYAPKPAFAVEVDIYNEKNEYDTMKRFFKVIIDYKPTIITSFNGDKFDWPFIENRCVELNLNVEAELGIRKSEETGEYFGRYLSHLDCFPWVERDAYLP